MTSSGPAAKPGPGSPTPRAFGGHDHASGLNLDRNRFFRQLVAYGALVVAVAPVVLWLVFVVVLG